MKLIIESVTNGYILEYADDESEKVVKWVCPSNSTAGSKEWADSIYKLLWDIRECLGENYSKHHGYDVDIEVVKYGGE